MTRLEPFTAAPCRPKRSALRRDGEHGRRAACPEAASLFCPGADHGAKDQSLHAPTVARQDIKNRDRWRGGSIKILWEGEQFLPDVGPALSGMPNIVGTLRSCKRPEAENSARRGPMCPDGTARVAFNDVGGRVQARLFDDGASVPACARANARCTRSSRPRHPRAAARALRAAAPAVVCLGSAEADEPRQDGQGRRGAQDRKPGRRYQPASEIPADHGARQNGQQQVEAHDRLLRQL